MELKAYRIDRLKTAAAAVGADMIVAGLSAEGETEILDNGYINRGYDRFDACLSALGADVRCVPPQ